VLGLGTTVCAIILLINRNRFFLTVSQNSKSKRELDFAIRTKIDGGTLLYLVDFDILRRSQNLAQMPTSVVGGRTGIGRP
jgi:hypothetical protein